MKPLSEINQKKINELFEWAGTDPKCFEAVTKMAKIIKPELRKRNIILFLHTLITFFAVVFIIYFVFIVPMSLFSIIVFALITNIIYRNHLKGTTLIIQINEDIIIQKLRNYLRDYLRDCMLKDLGEEK